MDRSIVSATDERRPAGPRWRLASAIAVGCSALSLACIAAAATARPDRERRAPHPPAQGNLPTPADVTVPAITVEAPKPAGNPHEAGDVKARGIAKAIEAGTRKAGRHLRRAAAGAPTESAPASSAQLRAQVGRHAHAAGRRVQAAAHRLRVAAQRQTSRAPAGASGGAKASARGTPVSSSGSATGVAAPLGIAPAQIPPSTPAATVGAARTGPLAPALLVGQSPQRSTGVRRGRHASRPLILVALTPTAVATAAAAPGTVASRLHAPKAVRRAAARPSQIVTTITRIIGVVPTQMWALIGALCALALAFAARSRFAALRARRLEKQRRQLLEDVGLLQAALLPIAPARLGPVGTTAAYRPADGPGAGGDFYDVFALEDGKLAVIVGDVSGHGRAALPHTALVRFTLRAYLEAGLSPRMAVRTAGAVLDRQLGGSFATVTAATYEPRERVLVYSCAGHPPPIVLGSQPGSQRAAHITVSSSLPIGAGMRTGARQTVVSVPGGAQVCFHTDGVTEARVGADLFGSGRLTDALIELGPDATASTLLERVTEETDSRPDDMAACLLRIEGGAAAPKVLLEELELDREDAASDRTEQFLLACGVERRDVEEVIRSARAAAERVGNVVLELRPGDGPPKVALHRENLAHLQTRRAERQADLRVSL